MNFAAHNARALDEILRKRWPGGEVLRGAALLPRNAKVADPSGRPDRPLWAARIRGSPPFCPLLQTTVCDKEEPNERTERMTWTP